ncbi:MAG: type II toxin-antitoxin system VapC family toxin [Terriglobia bacterium]
MTLVDSSVWIDFFSKAPGPGGRELRRLIAESEPLALSGAIVTEVLQGLRQDIDRIERHLRLWDLLEPRGVETYRNAAGLVRLARSRGVTLTTVDALIAILALEHGAALFTLDGDFRHIGRFTGLKLHEIAAV